MTLLTVSRLVHGRPSNALIRRIARVAMDIYWDAEGGWDHRGKGSLAEMAMTAAEERLRRAEGRIVELPGAAFPLLRGGAVGVGNYAPEADLLAAFGLGAWHVTASARTIPAS